MAPSPEKKDCYVEYCSKDYEKYPWGQLYGTAMVVECGKWNNATMWFNRQPIGRVEKDGGAPQYTNTESFPAWFHKFLETAEPVEEFPDHWIGDDGLDYGSKAEHKCITAVRSSGEGTYLEYYCELTLLMQCYKVPYSPPEWIVFIRSLLESAALLIWLFNIYAVALWSVFLFHFNYRARIRDYRTQRRAVSTYWSFFDEGSSDCKEDDFRHGSGGACDLQVRQCRFDNGRATRWIVALVRSKIGPQKRTEANRLVVQREMLSAMKDHGMRPSHINQVLPYAVRLFFVPSDDDLAALKLDDIDDLKDRLRHLKPWESE